MSFQSKPGEVKKAVKVALEAGYRHFDALADYENEDEIGSALAEYISSGKLKREDVFITAKVSVVNLSAHDCICNNCPT